LLLAEQGKLSLDDAVGKYIPGLTRGDDITIRMILSHTSGYQDYAPQDYMIPEWLVPVRADQILERWAKRPLDFDPGTKWQYSNTNYVIAGLIVEKVAGMPLPAFLAANVFGKLGMKSVTDDALLGPTDATGYFRRARGPLHVSPHMARAWMFAAGDLAMTAEDLATWDVSLMDGTILSPASCSRTAPARATRSGSTSSCTTVTASCATAARSPGSWRTTSCCPTTSSPSRC
jgi:CubicO group peptidase (beta-lactamase class C family)